MFFNLIAHVSRPQKPQALELVKFPPRMLVFLFGMSKGLVTGLSKMSNENWGNSEYCKRTFRIVCQGEGGVTRSKWHGNQGWTWITCPSFNENQGDNQSSLLKKVKCFCMHCDCRTGGLVLLHLTWTILSPWFSFTFLIGWPYISKEDILEYQLLKCKISFWSACTR